MRILQWIRQRQIKALNEKQGKLKPYEGFKKAKRFGILIEANTGQAQALTAISKHLNEAKKKFEVLAYYPTKELPDKTNHFAYGKKDTNWLGRPSGGDFKEFTKNEYAAVFDLTTNPLPTFEYTRAQIKTTLYIGFGTPQKPHCQLQIQASVINKTEAAVAEAIKFLKFINN